MTNDTILLVEDSPDDEFLTLRTLRRNNVGKVVVARDGMEAIDYLFGNGVMPVIPWFILLDLKLPMVDGIEVLETIRADDRTRWVPVVVMSSSQEPHESDRCAELGVDLYITKPLDSDKLQSLLQKVAKPRPCFADAHPA